MGEKGTMTRRHILDSACPLFIRHGYKAVTMQDICRASGLSKGGLYRHYKDKSSLFSDLLQSFQEDRRLHRDSAALFMNTAWKTGKRNLLPLCQPSMNGEKNSSLSFLLMESGQENSIWKSREKPLLLSFLW